MIKISITALAEGGNYSGGYGPDVSLDFFTSTEARFGSTVLGNSDQVILKGRNLTYADNMLIGGTVTRMIYADEMGNPYAVISGFEYKAKFLGYDGDGYLQHFSLNQHFIQQSNLILGSGDAETIQGSGGRDILRGFGGDDWLFGGPGKDVYTGGKGNDGFYVDGDEGRTVITDFDATGGDGRQDKLLVHEIDYEKRRAGDDTIVTLDENTSVRLLGVRPSQITDADFQLYP